MQGCKRIGILVTTVLGTAIGLDVPDIAKAQLPFYTGMTTPEGRHYAVETRASIQDGGLALESYGKMFKKPVWAYAGGSYNTDTLDANAYYGVGPVLSFQNRFYTLPTVEGSSEQAFSGGTFYSTALLGKGFFMDLNPGFDKKGRHTITHLNFGKSCGDMTFGISSDISNRRLRRLADTDFRVMRARNGNFVSGTVNFGKRKVRVVFQRAF